MSEQGSRRRRRLKTVTFAACAALLAFAFPASPAHAQNRDLLEQARAAAGADRNAQSARLFAQYLAAHPDQRRQVLREYADKLIYSRRPDQAVPLLREVLTWDLTPEERLQAQRSLALALLWSDQHRQAISAYDALLAARPGDNDSTFNRIRAVQWLGRPDLAAQMLLRLPAHQRENPRAAEIAGDIRDNSRPLTEASVEGFDQADGLDLTRWRLEQQLFTLSGAASITPFYEHSRFDQGSAGRVTIKAPGVAARLRATDWLQISGQGAVERQSGAGIERSIGVYEASLAFLPADNLRLDLVTARRSLDNLKSLQMGITTRHYFGSIDYWPGSLLKLTIRGELTHFSDGNDRRWAQVEAERRLSREPHIFIGARATAFRFDEQLDHGYFNPKTFRSLQLTGRGWSRIGEKTWLDLAGAVGPEDSSPGGTKLAYWLRGRLSQGLGDRLELSLTAERLSSGQTTTGFARNSISGAVRVRW